MKKYFLLLIALACLQSLPAQIHKRITLSAGDDLSKTLGTHGAFRYAGFAPGVISFKNGKKISASLNYNVLLDEMFFVGDKGDTLVIGNPADISYLTIGDNWFFYDNGYLEVIASSNALKLARSQKITLEAEKVGGYGEPANTASIDSYKNFYTTGNTTYSLTLNQNTVVTKNISYFWVSNDMSVLPATEDNLLTIIGIDKKTNVDGYVKQKKISFRAEDDLVKLLQYCAG